MKGRGGGKWRREGREGKEGGGKGREGEEGGVGMGRRDGKGKDGRKREGEEVERFGSKVNKDQCHHLGEFGIQCVDD